MNTRKERTRFLLFLLDLPTATSPRPLPREITSSRTYDLYCARISHGGTWVTFEAVRNSATGDANENPAIYVVPVSGGEWTLIAGGNSWNDKPNWSADGKTIYFVLSRGGLLNLWGIRFDPLHGNRVGLPFQVSHFGDSGAMMADRDITLSQPSFGRSALAVPMADASGSIWMLDNIDR